MTAVPNKPKTPIRSFRVDPALYERVKAEAERRGETVTDVVVRAMKEYVR